MEWDWYGHVNDASAGCCWREGILPAVDSCGQLEWDSQRGCTGNWKEKKEGTDRKGKRETLLIAKLLAYLVAYLLYHFYR